MNKVAVVLGVAAVATLAGCKDPDYRYRRSTENEVKVADGTDVVAEPTADAKTCVCAPGTVHAAPCACGAADCKCAVAEPAPTSPVSIPVEPDYTVYIVQRGDYLAKISKKFNIKVDAIKKLNNMKSDTVRIGQKIKLPGKVDVGEQTVPAGAVAIKDAGAKAPAKKAFTPYTGATKEYVVKSGDTLGHIAYGSGINIRQLKELNGLKNDKLRIGQKLKVPAEAVVSDKTPVPVDEVKPLPSAATEAVEPVPATDASVEAVAPAAEPPVEAAPADAPVTYTIQEGDDMTSVSIRWGISAAAIRELNNLADDDQLVPGQVIKLPAEAQQ